MLNYEKLLFSVAPWTQEVMKIGKTLNEGSFNRGRSGWVKRGVENPETIYEHTCKVALAAWYLFGTQEAVDQGVIHDFPEIFERDYLPKEIDLDEKKDIELAVMKKLREILPDGNYWFNAWNRFENEKPVKELDIICPSIQAINHLKTNDIQRLQEFYPYSRKKIQTPELIGLLDAVCLSEIPKSEDAYIPYFRGLEKIKI